MSDKLDSNHDSGLAFKDKPWSLPPIDQTDSESTAKFVQTSIVGLANHESKQQETFEQERQDGYQVGYAEGLKAAEQQLTQQQADLAKTVEFLNAPVKYVDAQVEQALLNLALAVAKQVLHREIKTDPKHIIGLIREAVKQLPPGDQKITIRLHPDNVGIVEETLKTNEGAHLWQFVKDPTLNRADCKIEAEPSHINAGIDHLITRLAAELLGGERVSDTRSEQVDEHR